MLNSNPNSIQRPGMTCMPIMCVMMKMSQDRHFKEGCTQGTWDGVGCTTQFHPLASATVGTGKDKE